MRDYQRSVWSRTSWSWSLEHLVVWWGLGCLLTRSARNSERSLPPIPPRPCTPYTTEALAPDPGDLYEEDSYRKKLPKPVSGILRRGLMNCLHIRQFVADRQEVSSDRLALSLKLLSALWLSTVIYFTTIPWFYFCRVSYVHLFKIDSML